MSLRTSGGSIVTVKSMDGEIEFQHEMDDETRSMFTTGVNEIHCHGFYDTQTRLIMLGKIIDTC
jgi:hypothetical protein